MNATIIAQKTKDRYQRALRLVEAGHVSPNGVAGQYYVVSQADRGRYLAATPEAFPPIGRCNCRDFQDFARHNGIKCKHVQAAEIFESAEATAQAWAKKHGISLEQLGDRILWDINKGLPEPSATKAVILFQAAMRLAEGGDDA